MMDGYWIMFASGFILGCIFYLIFDVAGILMKYLNLKRKELVDKSSLTEGGK